MSVKDAFINLEQGGECFLELKHTHCHSTFILLAGYCSLNFVYNTLGLLLTKKASSTVNAIAGSLLLPTTAIAFTAPIMGQFRESVKPEAVYGLVLIVVGFAVYQWGSYGSISIGRGEDVEEVRELIRSRGESKGFASPKLVHTFQEKIVFTKIDHGSIRIPVTEHDASCVGIEGFMTRRNYTGKSMGVHYGSFTDDSALKGRYEEVGMSTSV
jgi:hypothetical protein